MDNCRESAELSGFGEDRISAEAGRNEAEQFRQLAEEAREARDHHGRGATETIQTRARAELRETAETARLASEEARAEAGTARLPARMHGLPRTMRGKLWWMPCAPPPMR